MRKSFQLCAAVALAWLASAPSSLAETLHVATWSLAATAGNGTNAAARVEEAARALKKLKPEVILLEQVRDWQACRALAEALKPENYSVLVCSAFRSAAGGTNAPPQVAILSRRQGYFSWSEPWRGEGEPALPGGFAFAAVSFPKHRVGFFVAQLPPQLADTNLAAQGQLSHQWAQSLESYRSWVANRLEAVVVDAGDFAPDSAEGALATRLLSAPLQSTVSLPPHPARPDAGGVLDPVGLKADAHTVPGLILMGPQTACALDLDAPKEPVASAAPPKAVPTAVAPKPAETPPTVVGPAATPQSFKPETANFQSFLFAGGAFAAFIVMVGFWIAAVGFWARRRRARAAARTLMLPGNPVSSYTLVFSEQSIASPALPSMVQPPLPQRVPPPTLSGNAASPVEVWPPGPVLLSPEAQQATARDGEGLRANLAQFLKLKLVQRLLADRSELLQAQNAATGRLLSLEERLARLELQLQQQNEAYEQRIEELNRDLAAAKDENRELIRARIAQVKAEMQAARARLLAQARAEEQ